MKKVISFQTIAYVILWSLICPALQAGDASSAKRVVPDRFYILNLTDHLAEGQSLTENKTLPIRNISVTFEDESSSNIPYTGSDVQVSERIGDIITETSPIRSISVLSNGQDRTIVIPRDAYTVELKDKDKPCKLIIFYRKEQGNNDSVYLATSLQEKNVETIGRAPEVFAMWSEADQQKHLDIQRYDDIAQAKPQPEIQASFWQSKQNATGKNSILLQSKNQPMPLSIVNATGKAFNNRHFEKVEGLPKQIISISLSGQPEPTVIEFKNDKLTSTTINNPNAIDSISFYSEDKPEKLITINQKDYKNVLSRLQGDHPLTLMLTYSKNLDNSYQVILGKVELNNFSSFQQIAAYPETMVTITQQTPQTSKIYPTLKKVNSANQDTAQEVSSSDQSSKSNDTGAPEHIQPNSWWQSITSAPSIVWEWTKDASSRFKNYLYEKGSAAKSYMAAKASAARSYLPSMPSINWRSWNRNQAPQSQTQ